MREFCVQGDLDVASAKVTLSDLRSWLSEQSDGSEGRIEISQELSTQVALQLFLAGAQAASSAKAEITFGPIATSVLEASAIDMRFVNNG